MIFKTFDMEKSITTQGYIEESYDMIIASNVLHATKLLEETMKNTRRLLKPGGILLLLEVVNNEPLRNGLPMGGLPGWWIGADSGRPWGPTLSLSQWDSLLRKTGFSGVDTNTPDYDKLHPFSVFASQAVDDRVNVLRKPLSVLPTTVVQKTEDLVVIGGKTLQISRLVEDMGDLLALRFKTVTRIDSIEALEDITIPASSTILSVTELDEPTLKVVTAIKLECLKTLFSQARNMLWITRGCRADEPHSNMMVGLGRGLRFEYPNINLQMLDVDKLDDHSPQMFAESLIRLQTVDGWKRERPLDDLIWSIEPEVAVEGGMHMIPRLLTNQAQNDRYNSSRRRITRNIALQSSTVKIVNTGSSYELRDNSWRKPWPRSGSTGKIAVRVSHSLLQSIKIKSAGYFFLCVGSIVETGDFVLALSNVSESTVYVPVEWTVGCDSSVDPSTTLLSVAANLVAQQVTFMAPVEGTLLVYEPDTFLATALAKQAAERNIKLLCATTKLWQEGSNWIYIHPHSPQRLIRKAVPSDVSLFVNLSVHGSADEAGNRIAQSLPYQCIPDDETPFFGKEPAVRPGSSPAQIGVLLRAAWDYFMASNFEVDAPGMARVLPLVDVPLHTGIDEPTSVIDWTTNSIIPVNVQPVDSEDLFRPDRTYLLVGLSGEVGQSLCQWMVGHGARYVVLTSRNPKISNEWIELQEAVGATVKGFPL